jgi:hypothetical protein
MMYASADVIKRVFVFCEVFAWQTRDGGGQHEALPHQAGHI